MAQKRRIVAKLRPQTYLSFDLMDNMGGLRSQCLASIPQFSAKRQISLLLKQQFLVDQERLYQNQRNLCCKDQFVS